MITTLCIVVYSWIAGMTFGIASNAAQNERDKGNRSEARIMLVYASLLSLFWPVAWIAALGYGIAKAARDD